MFHMKVKQRCITQWGKVSVNRSYVCVLLSTFQGLIKRREYCARARMICSPEANDLNDQGELMDVNIKGN